MTKKGPLGKAESFYVKEHYKTQTPEAIAKDLDRAISTIRKAANKFKADHGETSAISAGEQMARRDGITIMTEGASMVSDARPKKNPRAVNCVTRTKKE